MRCSSKQEQSAMNIFINEFSRYQNLLEKTIAQINEKEFFKVVGHEGNSIAVILKHLSGNLTSRFTDFLTSDGEKPWRNRDTEFDVHGMNKAELMESWNKAWSVLENAVFTLDTADMNRTVTIRSVQFTVEEALARSLAHFAYHVGQIVFMGKIFKAEEWQYLSIAPGKSKEYNSNPTKEKGI